MSVSDEVVDQLLLAVDKQLEDSRRVERELKAVQAALAAGTARLEQAHRMASKTTADLRARVDQLRKRRADITVFTRAYGRKFHASSSCGRLNRIDGRGLEAFDTMLLGDALEVGLEPCGTWECEKAMRAAAA